MNFNPSLGVCHEASAPPLCGSASSSSALLGSGGGAAVALAAELSSRHATKGG
jgi:hypothetical protein